MKFTFGDIVIVEDNLIGVVVKSWIENNKKIRHEVYVRSYNSIKEYHEDEMERYMVRHKELSEEELEWQHNATQPFITDEEKSEMLNKVVGLFSDQLNIPDWYIKKTADLYSLYYDKYIEDQDGELVKIVGIDIDHDPNNQRMNRLTDENGNKHFIDEVSVVYTKEDVK